MPDEEKESQTVTELNVKVGPAEIRTKGYRLADLLSLAVAVGLGILVYIAYDTQQDVKVAAATLANATKADHDQLRASIDKGTDAQNKSTEAQVEQSYILTLDQKARERLNLRMPDSLRSKVIGRVRD